MYQLANVGVVVACQLLAVTTTDIVDNKCNNYTHCPKFQIIEIGGSAIHVQVCVLCSLETVDKINGQQFGFINLSG